MSDAVVVNKESNGITAVSEPVDVVYRLYLNDDRSAVLLDHPDPLSALPELLVSLQADLAKLELPGDLSADDLRSGVSEAALPDQPLIGHGILTGQAPVPPEDGRIVWSRDFFAEGWAIDEKTGSIDFWERAERRCVHANELLVRVTDAIAGEPGEDVYGNKIVVEKPTVARLRAGKGVVEVEEANGKIYYADFDGRISQKDGVVSVDEVYTIGEVSLATGNIHHSGSVAIDGDIRIGATVDVEGDIYVKGLVEPCNIRCGGTLTVAGGIIGADGHTIVAGVNVEARYIREADVSVEEDVIVGSEIDHCEIRARGRVQVVSGRIAGGCVTALKGIRVAVAGAKGSAVTHLVAGVDQASMALIQARRAQVKELKSSLAPIEAALHNVARSEAAPSPDLARVVADLNQRREVLDRAIGKESAQIEDLQAGADKLAVKQVVILRELWSGTTIQLGEHATSVTRSVPQPRLARLEDQEVRIVPLGEDNMPED